MGKHCRSRTCGRSFSSARSALSEANFGAGEERKRVSVVRSKIHVFLAKPLRVDDGAVKVVRSFVKFELACFRSYLAAPLIGVMHDRIASPF